MEAEPGSSQHPLRPRLPTPMGLKRLLNSKHLGHLQNVISWVCSGRGGEKPSGDSETSWWGGRQVPLTEPRLWAGPRTHVRLSPRPPPAPPQPPRTSHLMHANTTRGSPHTACWSFPPPGDEEERSCRRGRASPLHPATLLQKQPCVKSGLYRTEC